MSIDVSFQSKPLRPLQQPRPALLRFIFSPTIEIIAMYMYYIRDCYAGCFRYFFAILHMDAVWFLPDALAFLCVILFFYRQVVVGRSTAALLLMINFLFSFIVSMIFFQDFFASFSGVKMFIPVFVGLCFATRPVNDLKSIRFLFYFVFISTAVGILWNSVSTLPWEGFAYQGFGGVEAREAGRIWWQGEERRLGGFAADSTMAGFFLMAGFGVIALNSGLILRAAVSVVAIYVTYLSTSKTALGAIVIGCAILAMTWFFGKDKEYKFLRTIAKLSYATVLAPFLLVILLGGINLTEISSLLFSLQDRIDNSWVLPITYMADLFPFGFVTGCGLGCFNYPQQIFPTAVQQYWVPVDNFSYGTYLMMGLPWFGVLWLQVFVRRQSDPLIFISTILMNIFGITVLCYGPASSLLLYGIIYSNVFANQRYAQIIASFDKEKEMMALAYRRSVSKGRALMSRGGRPRLA